MKLLNSFFKLPGFVLALISIFFLILLGYYCWLSEEQITDNTIYLKNPQLYEGREILSSFCNVDEKLDNEIISRSKYGRVYYFIIDTNVVELNHIYSFKGNISNEGKIIVTDLQKHPHRILKYLFSLLSFPIIIFLIIKYIRFDTSSFTLLIKED